MKIALACDHAGYEMASALLPYLTDQGHQVADLRSPAGQSVDYPDYALPAALAVARQEADLAILVCGTGVGIGMVASKVPGLRVAHCHEAYTARLSRAHNDANVLTLGGRVIGLELAKDIVDTFLSTRFEDSERHKRRIAKITQIEKQDLVG